MGMAIFYLNSSTSLVMEIHTYVYEISNKNIAYIWLINLFYPIETNIKTLKNIIYASDVEMPKENNNYEYITKSIYFFYQN